jgi:hypothetical protein
MCDFSEIKTYELVHEEATLLPTQLKMVTEAKLTRQQRSSSRYLQSKFFEVWELYENGQLSASQLLCTCGQLNIVVLLIYFKAITTPLKQ